MRIRSITAAVIAALIAASAVSVAQVSKSTLTAQIASCFPDNTVGAITPAIVRTCLTSIVNSYQQYAGVNAQVGTTYTVQTTDYGQLITFNNAGAIAVTLPSAAGAGFSPFNFTVRNIGAGTVTITPAAGTINGAASYAVTSAQSLWVVSDGTNWQTASGGGSLGIGAGIVSNGGTIAVEEMAPGGRLTVAASNCSPSTDQVAQTIIYYAPCGSEFVPVFDSAYGNLRLAQFTSSATDTVGLSVSLGANWAANTLYDWFVGYDGSTLRLCSGPAWSNSGVGTSARGSGAGTTQLSNYRGLWVNAVSMTCRYSNASTFTCALNQCTYVGTALISSVAGQIDLKFGTTAANCGPAVLSIWNQYNRKRARANVNDSTVSWTYTTLAWRAANNSTNCSVKIVAGLPDDAFRAQYFDRTGTVAANGYTKISIGLNGSTTIASLASSTLNRSAAGNMDSCVTPSWDDVPTLGLSQIFAIESGDGANANNFFGQVGGGDQQQLLTVTGMM